MLNCVAAKNIQLKGNKGAGTFYCSSTCCNKRNTSSSDGSFLTFSS